MLQVIPITEINEVREAGLPFRSVDAIRWAHRRREQNGLAAAFTRVNGRVCIIVDRFHEAVRSGQVR